jgi:hypothetical protein
MMQFLAEAAAAKPDFMISGNWLIGALVVLIPVIGGVWLKGRDVGRRLGENAREVTLKKPVPTVVTREEAAWATKPDLDEHINRTDKHFAEVWDAIQGERGIARVALGRIHERIDEQSLATARVQGTVDEVKSNVGKLLDLALNRKPGTQR